MLYGGCKQCGARYREKNGQPLPTTCEDCGGDVVIDNASGPEVLDDFECLAPVLRNLARIHKPPTEAVKLMFEFGALLMKRGYKAADDEEFIEQLLSICRRFIDLGITPEEYNRQIREYELELAESLRIYNLAEHEAGKRPDRMPSVDDCKNFARFIDIAFGEMQEDGTFGPAEPVNWKKGKK